MSTSEMYGAPRLPTPLIERGRLLGLLDAASALTVLQAPAGFGKTTVVSHWARSRGRPGVWMPVDSDCGTRVNFWRRLAALMKAAGHRVDVGHRFGSNGDLRGNVIALATSISKPVVVVIDDFEQVRDRSVADDLLALVRHNELVSLVVLTRTSVSRRNFSADLEFHPQTIDGRQMCFTREETGLVLARAGAEGADAGMVHDVTAGVPFAVQVCALEVATADGRAALSQQLNSVVLNGLRKSYGRSAFGRFLHRISPAESIGVELAVDLAEVTPNAATRWLNRAETDGLGSWDVSPTTDGEARFSLVPIMRSALESELRRESAEQANELHQRYARWLMTYGDPYSAASAAVRAGDLALASKALRHGFFSVSAHDSERTVEVLESIPRSILQGFPLLALFLGTQYGATDAGRLKAHDMYNLAAASAGRLLREGTGDEAERFSLAVVEMVTARVTGRTETAAGAAERVLRMYRELSADAWKELDGLLTPTLTLVGHQSWLAGDIGRAVDVYAEASLIATTAAADVYTVPLLAAGTAAVGKMPAAWDWIERASNLDWPPGEPDDYLGSPYRLAEAIAALERFDLDTAQERVRAVDQTFISYEYWSWFMPIQAYLDAAYGRPHAGLVRMKAARDDPYRPSLTPQMRATHEVVTGLLHISAGELVLAERAVAAHPKSAVGALVVRALSALVSGAADQAFALTRTLRNRPHDPRFTAIALLLHSAAALRLGERQTARIGLEQAATLMDINGLRSPLSFLPARLLEAVGDFGIVPADWLVGVPRLFPDGASRYALTPREMRLLNRLATSAETLAEHAAELHVSVNTLRAQRASLYRKLGVKSRAEAAYVAETTGLLVDAS